MVVQSTLAVVSLILKQGKIERKSLLDVSLVMYEVLIAAKMYVSE